MSFQKVNRRYLLVSLKILILWVIFYAPTIPAYIALNEIFSDLYVMPAPGWATFVWLDWHQTIFYGIVTVSLIYNAVYILLVLPFTADSAKTKHKQFIFGFVLSILIMLLFLILALWIILGMEMRGIVFYSIICIIYFPLLFVVSRFFVPSTYREGFWFTGGKEHD